MVTRVIRHDKTHEKANKQNSSETNLKFTRITKDQCPPSPTTMDENGTDIYSTVRLTEQI